MAILAVFAAYAASFAPYHALYHLSEGIFPALWSRCRFRFPQYQIQDHDHRSR
jgi:hypothetical protein